jgi:hypothetical protein
LKGKKTDASVGLVLASGSAIMAAMKIPKRTALRKEITWVLLLKVAAIMVIWHFCFSDPPAKHIHQKQFVQHLVTQSTAS